MTDESMKMNGEKVQYDIKRVINCLLKHILSNTMCGICAHLLINVALFPSALNESNDIFFLAICKEYKATPNFLVYNAFRKAQNSGIRSDK